MYSMDPMYVLEDYGYNRPDGFSPDGYRPANYDGYGREDGYSREGAYRTFGIRADSVPYRKYRNPPKILF